MENEVRRGAELAGEKLREQHRLLALFVEERLLAVPAQLAKLVHLRVIDVHRAARSELFRRSRRHKALPLLDDVLE